MNETSSRLLTLLSLLQARRDWPGAELASRLEVSGRTIRRDVERLRDLGYPVESLTGPAGGYTLRAGTAMPPLLLDDDEAIAIAVGLRTAAKASVTGIEEAAVRALVKLEQVLPSQPSPPGRGARAGDDHHARRRPDRRPAGPDHPRRLLPRLGVPALRLRRPRRRRVAPRGRAALRRQPRPPLVPGRLGPEARGLADVPRRPARAPGVDGRAIHRAQAAGQGRRRLRHREHPRDAAPLRGGDPRPRLRRGGPPPASRGASSSRSTTRPASTGPATTTSTGSRCG